MSRQAMETPDSLALQFEDERLTYRELDQKSSLFAAYLKRRGVGPASLVAICVNRSPWMVIGLLGILKAGGAYVPLDPNYPAERLSYMLDDSEAMILVTESSLIDGASAWAGRIKSIAMDSH